MKDRDYKGDHAGTKAKEPGYQFSDLTKEERELVDYSMGIGRSAVQELDNRVREIQNRFDDSNRSGYIGVYEPVSAELREQIERTKSAYNYYADAIADPTHEELGEAKRALLRNIDKATKMVNAEGNYNLKFSKQLSMSINDAEKAIYGHKVGELNLDSRGNVVNPVKYNGKYKDPSELVMKNTGEKVSTELADAIRRAENGKLLTEEEYSRIPEVARSRQTVKELQRKYGVDSSIQIDTPEREALRKEFAKRIDSMGSARVDENGKVVYDGDVERGRRLDIVIGLPSSGKSSAIVDPLSNTYKSRVLDSDILKEMFEDFKDGEGAGFVHEESKKILASALDKALENGDNIVLPIVGGDAKKVLSYLEKADEIAGDGAYKFYLHINDLEPSKAMARNLRRYANQGRFLDLADTSIKYGDNPLKVFDDLEERGLFDGYTKLSNDVTFGENPRILSRTGETTLNFNWKSEPGRQRGEGTIRGMGQNPGKPESELPLSRVGSSSANNTAFSMRKNNADRLATDVKSFDACAGR